VNPDFAIIGGGIVGLTVARALAQRKAGTIVVFEKEPAVAAHASGRNSGVLHSGIYYAEGSLKARICAEGARRMAAYCDERGLPIRRVGKLILPTQREDGGLLEMLQARGKANGAQFELVDEARIREIEPDAHSADGRGLYNPETAVVEPAPVVEGIAAELRDLGVTVRTGCEAKPVGDRTLVVAGERVSYGHLINAAGAYADRVAHAMGVGARYRILPFKGAYYKLREGAGVRVNGLIYPVPDLRIPVLGVHTTRTVSGGVYLGPTASPALGRENYRGLQGFSAVDATAIAGRVAQQYLRNIGGFRSYLHREASRMLKPGFLKAARALLPRLEGGDLLPSNKVGIRAQLLDTEKGALEMDFVVEDGPHSTHVLNAISPAFTASFPFAELVLERIGGI
jgi:L-2-hydroxyglutarate oxidase